MRPGLVAAVPVAAMLALGTIIGEPVGAVTMGAGALLVGVAWRGDGPSAPPLGTMAVAALMLALATLVGTLSGRWDWLHVGVLFLFCLLAGLATSIGRRGGVVGTQTLIAFIVFGRFPESALGGLRLAGLVLAGGSAQLLFAALIAAPLAWRRQRQALAEAYHRLADLAEHLTVSGVRSAEDLDAAEQALETPALFGDRDLGDLITLVAEGRRIRLELLVLSGAIQRRAEPDLAEPMAVIARGLALIAQTLDGADPDDLEGAAAALRHWGDGREDLPSPQLEARVAAIGGQVRAAARHAVAVSRASGTRRGRLGRPSLGSPRLLGTVGADVVRMRENATLASVAGRHALRLAVVVAGTEVLSQHVGLPRAYWMTVTTATVLRPSYAATFQRGAERVLGTLTGVVIATLIAVAINPSGWGTVAVVGAIAALTFTVFPGSFALGVAGLTALIVFLLHTVYPGSASIALDRGIDTLIGGAIGLGATLVWPTWSAAALPRDLAVLVAAEGSYLRAVLARLFPGSRTAQTVVVASARSVSTAYADAEAALMVARGEPARRRERLGAEQAAAALIALRRVSSGIHALRLLDTEPPLPELAPLTDGLTEALDVLARRLGPEAGGSEPLPPLRRLYRACATDLPEALGLALDELVDAIDSAAAALEA